MAKAKKSDAVASGMGLFTDYDELLFKEGNHFQLYEKLGAHPRTHEGGEGTHFAVWAPNARSVTVIGEFNGWDKKSHQLAQLQDGTGIWEGFIPDVGKGALYKYHIESRYHRYRTDRGDPFAFFWEEAPRTSSIV